MNSLVSAWMAPAFDQTGMGNNQGVHKLAKTPRPSGKKVGAFSSSFLQHALSLIKLF